MNIRAVAPLAAAAIVATLYFANSNIASADPVTKEDAVAMVQKAVAAIKSEGAEKAYTEISNLAGPFVKGDLYIAVVGFDGTLLAYGSDVGERVGNNVMDIKDSDGKEVDVLAILQIHQPRDQDDRAEADVLRASRGDRRLRRRVSVGWRMRVFC